MTQQFFSNIYTQKNWKQLSKYMYTKICNSTLKIAKRWKQTREPPVGEWINCGMYMQWVLFSYEKKWSRIYNTIWIDPWKHHHKWKKNLDTKDHILLWLHL